MNENLYSETLKKVWTVVWIIQYVLKLGIMLNFKLSLTV